MLDIIKPALDDKSIANLAIQDCAKSGLLNASNCIDHLV